MKAKQFFKHTGLALGYLAVFFLLQYWVSSLYLVGAGAALGFRGLVDPDAITEALVNISFEQVDVIMLLAYAASLAFFGCFLFAEQPGAPLRAAHIKRPRRAAMLWSPVLLGVSAFFAVQGSLMLIPEDAPLMQQYIESASALDYGVFPFLSFLTTVIGAPVIEEIVFRGLIYKHLKRAMPVWLAVLIQALLFAVAHGQLLWMTYTFVLGAIFALLYDYFDSLWPCIIAHLIFNGSNYLPFLETLTLEPIGWVIVMLASLLLCALTLLLLVIYRTLIERSPARHV